MAILIHPTPGPTVSAAEIEAWRTIPVAVAVDLTREIGQVDPTIRPLNPPGRQPRLFGRAVTAHCHPPDFGAVVQALDLTGPGDVLVIAAAGNAEVAMIGEVLGGYLRKRGCVGVVCDGAVRDVGTLASWPDFSVYTRFVTPRGPDSAGQGSVNTPVMVGGQMVSPGDLVIGDDDGVAALSPDTVRSRIGDAQKRLALEADWVRKLSSGGTAADTFGLKSGGEKP
ncbi:MAG: dimethylmenaquinone methyltransferase [Bauldia sp.]|nr:dimethylmenaquinone methyltransferase [Bauldia sp.]